MSISLCAMNRSVRAKPTSALASVKIDLVCSEPGLGQCFNVRHFPNSERLLATESGRQRDDGCRRQCGPPKN